MSKMSRKLFSSIILVSLAVLVAAMVLTFGTLYQYYSGQYKDSLRSEAACIAAAIDTGGDEYLKRLDTEHRVTLIAEDGTVIFDSEKDPASMQNHLDRAEVAEAIEEGTGYAERYSSTLAKKTVNYAYRLSDGRVLRLSDTQFTIFSMLGSVALPVVFILVLAVLLSLLLAMRATKAITAPINRIDPEHPEKAKIYAELAPLLGKISAQNEQLNIQMNDLRVEHEKQDAMRRDFTANVSHELKTPLTSISGYAEIIKNGIAKDEDVRRFAGKIYDESQRLITLVGDIIKLSQLDGKDITVKIENIDLYDTCAAVLSQLEMAARERGVEMTLTGEHINIRGAEQIVEEMIFNLCDNAVKYNKPGGSVTVALKQYADGAEVSVTDTGIGIPQEELSHIFERFYRVDKSHSKEIGGTGLGLSIVKHGAKFMGAQISVDSKLDIGTTIRVLF